MLWYTLRPSCCACTWVLWSILRPSCLSNNVLIASSFQPSPPHTFFSQRLSSTWNLTSRWGWLAIEPHRTHLSMPSQCHDYRHMPLCKAFFFLFKLGFEIELMSCLPEKAIYYFSNPNCVLSTWNIHCWQNNFHASISKFLVSMLLWFGICFRATVWSWNPRKMCVKVAY